MLFVLFPPATHSQQPVAAALRQQRARVAAAEPAAAVRRARSFFRSHGAEGESSPAVAIAAARVQHLALASAQATPLSTAWVPAGPSQVQSQSYGLVTGRVTSLALDPNDATNNTLYVGTSGGGVWKSSSAASSVVSFAPLTDTLPVFSPNSGTSVIPSLSIGALTVQPGGTGVVLAGTGDPNDAADSYYGEGVLRSANGGQTWSLVQTSDAFTFSGEGIAGFAWSTASPNLVVMAVSSAEEAANVGATKFPGVRGLYFSTNAGQTWTLATLQDDSTILQNRTTNYTGFRGNAATSVVWNPVRKKFYAAIRAHGYYESADGITWTRMASQPGAGLTAANCPSRPGDYGLLSCPIFRGTLAVQPVSGDLFAVTVDPNNGSQGLWQDACAKSGTACDSATVAWGTKIDTSPAEDNGNLDAGDYNLALAAVPAATALSSSDTLLFLGTADLYRCSLAGGCLLRNTTNATTGCAAPAGVAPAHHAIAWGVNLSNSAIPTMFFGNDGGLWRSLDGVRQTAGVCSADDAAHFDNLNGTLGSLAEVNSLASDPSDANVMLAALGANGSAASTTAAQASAQAPWTQMSAAESGTVAIDQGNGANWLVQSGGGVALHACADGKLCTAFDFSGPAAVGAEQVSSDASLPDPPALLDPALNTSVLVGTCRVWRGPGSGGGWSPSNAISAPLGSLADNACGSADPEIRSLAAGGPTQLSNGSQNSGSAVLYAGLSGSLDGGSISAGHIYSTTAAGVAGASTVWTDLSGNAVTNDTSNRFNAAGLDVSSIAVDRSDSSGLTVYATVRGFGVPHVYRSINGGASWLNISANLPNAPANAVAVDPNNPRVVYVAMDTGVYVAGDVTTCVASTSNTTGACWSVYGVSLPNAPVTSLFASGGVSLPGSASAGILRAGTYGRGIWQTPLVTAGQTASPTAVFAPASLTFGTQAVGTTSASQAVTLTNTGTAALQISGVAPSSGFLVETDTCSGTSVSVGGTCSLTVSFAPVADGPVTGSVEVLANLPGGHADLPLTGTATGTAKISLAPTSIAFGDVAVNAVSAVQTVTVTNSGTAAAALTAPVASAGYTVASNACGPSLPAASVCTIGVTFAPLNTGPNNGSLTVGDALGSHTVELSGNAVGTPNVVYSATSLSFHDGAIDTVGGSAVLTLTNKGTAQAHLGTPAIVGDFQILGNTCGQTLDLSVSCSMTIFFIPTGTGLRTGTLTLSDDSGMHTIALSGNGLAATSISVPAQVTFPQTEVNNTSLPQTITITDTGGTLFRFGIPQVIGDFGVTSQTTCGMQLNPGKSCQIVVVFHPTAEGDRTGSVSLPDVGAPPLAYTTLLFGTGHGTPRSAVSPSSLSFGSIGIGAVSDPQTVTVGNAGTAALALQAPVVSGDFRIVANSCGASLAAGASCTLSVTFAPSTDGLLSGTLAFTDALGTHTISLSGSGSGHANVAVSPGSMDFGTVALGGSAPLGFTVSNSGNASIGLLAPSASGDFHISATTCGSTIAAGGSCGVTVAFTPTIDGAETGMLTIADTAAAHTALLTGDGRGTAAVAFTPAALSFGNTAVNGTSAMQTVILANTGTASATLGSASVSGEFKLAANGCGTKLAVGAQCSIGVVFAPSSAGIRSGSLMLTDAAGTHSVALQGVGTAGVLSVAPTSIAFTDTTPNTASASRSVVLTNSGNGTLKLGAVAVTGDFAAGGNCSGVSLAGGASCTLSVTFSPTSAGARSGVLSIPSDSEGNPASVTAVTLTGNGKASFNITLLPASASFGAALVGSASAPVNITISNTGTGSGALGNIGVSGGDFTLTANTCGSTLPAGTGCTVSVVFSPSSTGPRSGTLTIRSDAGTQAVPLTGTGNAPATDTLAPLSLTFGPQVTGTVSSAQTVTLTNNGDVPLTLIAATVLSGDFTAVNACGPTLPAHTSCAIRVNFVPAGVGARTGVLQVSDVQHAQTVVLNGIAIAGAGVSLSPSSLVFANTGVGAAGAGQTLTLSNNGGVPLQISAVTVTGNFGVVAGSSTCAAGTPVPVGGSCSMSIAFLPDGAGQRTGTVTVTGNAPTQVAQLSGTGIDFTLSPDGSSSVTLSSGGSAAFPLLLRPSQSTNDPVTFACTGAPANARCTVTSQYNDLSATGTVTVTVLTGTATGNSVRLFALLPLLAAFPLFLRRRALRGAVLALLALTVLFATQGCGADKVSAAPGTGSGGSGSGSGGAPTPSGTYTITASATAAGVTHSVPLTLKVQ